LIVFAHSTTPAPYSVTSEWGLHSIDQPHRIQQAEGRQKPLQHFAKFDTTSLQHLADGWGLKLGSSQFIGGLLDGGFIGRDQTTGIG
jgi:hypothetical protein